MLALMVTGDPMLRTQDAVAFDLRQALVESYAVNGRMNQIVLQGAAPSPLQGVPVPVIRVKSTRRIKSSSGQCISRYIALASTRRKTCLQLIPCHSSASV